MSKISIQFDIAFNIFFPLTATHDYAPMPPVPPAVPVPATPLTLVACAFEIPVTMLWPPGNLLGKNKLTTTVKHNDCTITQDGHDCGSMIVHAQMLPAPNNLMTAVQIPFSSRKSMFSASTVTMNKKSVACNTLVGLPPTPMMYCANPMSMPLGSGDTSHLNSVSVGMTWVDIVLGVLAIAASMIIDKLLNPPSKFKAEAPKGGQDVIQEILEKALLGDATSLKSFFLKTGLAVGTGLARMGFTDGPVSFDIKLGDTYFEQTVTVSRDASGERDYSFTTRAASATMKFDDEGITLGDDGLTGSTDEETVEWGGEL